MIHDEFYTNVDLYKRGLFDFISYYDENTNEVVRLHKKQIQALEYFNDDVTTYVGYGGAARGGKSLLISLSALLESYAYPESRYLIGRRNLTILWQTTWKTLYKTMDNFGFQDKKDFSYNGQKHELYLFEPKSEIIAKNLEKKPSDEEATEFGSLEITKGFIDQSEHVELKIIEKVGERVGTHAAYKYGIKGKLMECFNPAKTHVNRRYWKPFRDKTEKNTRKFVRALPQDNPGKEAVKWVKEKEAEFLDGTMSKVEYQKQVKGNFDYDDDPTRLCEYDDILAIFKNDHVPKGKRYITADIARLGSDKAVILVWDGWNIIDYKVYALSLTTDIQNCINDFRSKYQIAKHYCVADQDGLGAGVVDNCGIKGFVNNSKPLKEELGERKTQPNYRNLQVQCGYYLSRMINQNQINFECDLPETIKEAIIEELEQLKSYNSEKDAQKVYLLPKDQVKENIGRSPDWRDALLMRAFFDLKPERKKSFGSSKRER